MQTDTCGIRTHARDPIGLAGRRLNHPAKVSLTRSTRNHGTQTSAHTNAHTPATHAPLHTTRAPSGNTTQTLARPIGERTNMHAANTRRCNTPIGVANGKRPRGPMDKASAHGAGDCRFESCLGYLRPAPTAEPGGACKNRHRGDSNPCGQNPMDFESISLTARTQCHGHSRERNTPRHRKPKTNATAKHKTPRPGIEPGSSA